MPDGSSETPALWLPVAGYEGLYEVSDQGTIRSLPRTEQCGGFTRSRQGRESIGGPSNPTGYLRASLCRDGVQRSRFVHHIVLETFRGPRPTGFQGCHINGNFLDNRVSNLRWASVKTNAEDRVRHGNDVYANTYGKQVECKRGHLLAGANLDAAHAKRLGGRRRCLACRRALSYGRHHPEIANEQMIQTWADRYYAEIMAMSGAGVAT